MVAAPLIQHQNVTVFASGLVNEEKQLLTVFHPAHAFILKDMSSDQRTLARFDLRQIPRIESLKCKPEDSLSLRPKHLGFGPTGNSQILRLVCDRALHEPTAA